MAILTLGRGAGTCGARYPISTPGTPQVDFLELRPKKTCEITEFTRLFLSIVAGAREVLSHPVSGYSTLEVGELPPRISDSHSAATISFPVDSSRSQPHAKIR